VDEADGAQIVGGFGELQRALVERDRARLVGARRRQAPVQPPQRRQAAGANRVAEGVGGASERGRGLIEIVLEQRRFGRHRSHGELFVARQRGRAQLRREQLRGLDAAASLERGSRAP